MSAYNPPQNYALAITASDHRPTPPVVYDLTGAPIDIGSAESNHIVLSEPTVDAHHLAIRRVRGQISGLIDLSVARRHAEKFWLERRSGDSFLCREHGQLPDQVLHDRCPLCGENARSLLLLRPLQPGDVFPIGQEFEASVLSQATTGLTARSTAIASLSPWPEPEWLEDPPRQPTILFDDDHRTLERRDYPFDDSNLWAWDPPESPFPVFIHQRVNRYTSHHARANGNREVGGLLLGRVYVSAEEGIAYPVINHAISARFATEARGHLTFTHQTWLDFIAQREEHFPHDEVVGWYHTHPGLDIFLSEWDLLIHRNFFRQPWQVAMVLDPHQDRAGFFVWSNNTVLDPLTPHTLFRMAENDEGAVGGGRPRVRIRLVEEATP